MSEDAMKYDHDQVFSAVSAAIRAVEHAQVHSTPHGPEGPHGPPFFTISRQAGAGGRTFARLLVERLNEVDAAELPWTTWDNELVERVAVEHRLRADRVRALEDERPAWLEEALAGLAIADPAAGADEFCVFRRVATAIRALAEMGRVVIVGRRGAMITRDLPGGIHLRLVASLAFRVASMVETRSLSPEAAAAEVRRVDRNRDAFYRRHWPGHAPPPPEDFTAVFNTGMTPIERLVDAALALSSVQKCITAARKERSS
jgi:hypothetical protein